MAPENAEIVLEGLRLFEAEDFDTLAQVSDPAIRITGPEGWPEPGPFEGRDAVMGQFRRLTSEWGEHRFRDVEIVDEGDHWVVVGFIWEVRGTGSGAAVASRLACAYRFHDGRFIEMHFRWTPEEALEAAGLSE